MYFSGCVHVVSERSVTLTRQAKAEVCVCVCVSVCVFTCTCQADDLSEKHRASWTLTTLWLSARIPSASQPSHYHFGSFLLLPASTHCFALIHCIAHKMNSMLMKRWYQSILPQTHKLCCYCTSSEHITL